MNIDKITQRVKKIDKHRNDNEKAHVLEDELHLDFIKYIATLKDENGEMAREILKTRKIDFCRWCA